MPVISRMSVLIGLIFSTFLIVSSFSYIKRQEKKKVVFFGDSITQAAVNPGGYIDVLNKKLSEQNLSSKYELIGAGIGGNKIYDLYLRMDSDVLKKNPDIVVIYVGVNDVWHKASSGTGTDQDKFVKFYNAVLAKLKAQKIKVIVCTPAVIGERNDFSNQQDGDLNRYSNLIRNIAQEQQLPLVDLRKVFLEYSLANNPDNKESGILTTDRVHLNPKGNEIVAEQMWKEISKIR
ncbi:SGNH/GDSL hydrolase family protein [Pollutibacter soli]|uniref:SGNH/GDSL hydrolase family protein n=1 Tax=Pollutibacter soli TaxID=3034157 RepID=UPI003013D580